MTTTTRLGITLLEVGQREKEATINDGFIKIDAAIKDIQDTNYLGDLATDPGTSYRPGTTYFNTTSQKLKVLRANLIWANAA